MRDTDGGSAKQHDRTTHCQWPGCEGTQKSYSAYCPNHQVDIRDDPPASRWLDVVLVAIIGIGGIAGVAIASLFLPKELWLMGALVGGVIAPIMAFQAFSGRNTHE